MPHLFSRQPLHVASAKPLMFMTRIFMSGHCVRKCYMWFLNSYLLFLVEIHHCLYLKEIKFHIIVTLLVLRTNRFSWDIQNAMFWRVCICFFICAFHQSLIFSICWDGYTKCWNCFHWYLKFHSCGMFWNVKCCHLWLFLEPPRSFNLLLHIIPDEQESKDKPLF